MSAKIKKVLALLLCASMLCVFASCGGDSGKEQTTTTAAPVTTTEKAATTTTAPAPATVKVPDVTGITEQEAIDKLTAAGLEAFVIPCTGAADNKGKVLYQNYSPDYETAAGTRVVISVSNGMDAEESALVAMEDPFV